jgi:hypothetical protein
MLKDIYTPCSQCDGTGTEQVSTIVNGEPATEEIPCRTCPDSSGMISNLSLSDDLITLLNDMDDKINDIREKVTEIKDGM